MTAPLLRESIYLEDLYSIPPLVTIILNQPWAKVTEAERQQLSKILVALALSLDKVRIIYQDEINLNQLPDRPKKVIGFGLALKGVNLFEAIEVESTQIVLSESLQTLLFNDESRKKLWLALKPIFGR